MPRAAHTAAIAGCLVMALSAAEARGGDGTTLFGGRLLVGAQLSGTLAPEDLGYFNYNDYATDTLRLFRVDLSAEARLAQFASVLFDVRSDNLKAPRVYALYLRVRPWRDRDLDLQAGLVPPVFGSFARRRYASDNPLPSTPLAYQYLTTLREDAVPANAEQMVAQRGRGWLVRYPIGVTGPEPGVPLVNADRWDAGVELRVGVRPLSLAVAVTQGTLSYPEVRDDNDGKQLSARLAWTPVPGFVAGLSGASGEFLGYGVQAALPEPAPGSYRQQALGVDLEWSAGQLILRGEAIFSRWNLPAIDPTRIEDPLDALGLFVEARYKLRPGLYLASRVEHLTMAAIPIAVGEQGWDAPVTRVELGAGFSPRRRVLLKASWQHNQRDGGRVPESDLVAAQVLLWF